MKEELLKELQGSWMNNNDGNETLKIIDENATNESGIERKLYWRNDLEQWVIGGTSIQKLKIIDGILHLEIPSNQIFAGKTTFSKVH